MATKKTTKKTTKAKAKSKPRATSAPKGDLVTFALRLPKAERDAFHKAAGPAGGCKFARRIMGAFAAGDVKAFQATLKDAKQARS